MSINAVQALNLRKPDHRNNFSSNMSQASSAYNKKSNIKDILVRNFFRKYQIGAADDMQQLKVERQVAQEIADFVHNTPQISSKNLHDFEQKLAAEVNLSKKVVEARRSSPDRALTNKNLRLQQRLGAKNTISPANQLRMSSQNHVNRIQNKRNQQFQLPQINSQVNLRGAKVSSSIDISGQRQGFRAQHDSANRRSQVVTGIQSPEDIYGGKTLEPHYTSRGDVNTLRQSTNQLGMPARTIDLKSKILAQQQAAEQQQPTSQMNKTGLRNLSLTTRQSGVVGGVNNLFPQSTRENPVLRQSGSIALMPLATQMMVSNSAQRKPESQPTGASIDGRRIHQKLRKLPDTQRYQEVENIPSDISDDEWGEIQKFGQKLHEEQIRKQKAAHDSRQKQVKEVLDQQVKLRAELREKMTKEKEDFDKRIVEKAKRELDQEKQQQAELHAKVFEQKKMRDIMLSEAQQKHEDDLLRHTEDEKMRVNDLRAQLEKERLTKLENKKKEREAAMKVIKDNMFEKKKMLAQQAAIKKADADQVETNMRLADEQETTRQNEIAERGKKIQRVMDQMGDIVKDNGKELQKKQEREYIQQCIEKDDHAHLQDIDRKNKDRLKHQQLSQALQEQVSAKRMKLDVDARANRSYMHRWTKQVEDDNKERVGAEQARKQKITDNAQFLRDQMQASSMGSMASPNQTGQDLHGRKKNHLGGLMNPEEARMNRALLQEIARVKRGEEPTGLLDKQSLNPI